MNPLNHTYNYCLNLDTNPDRWDRCIKEFQKVGIHYVHQRIEIASKENHFLSFNKAHYDAIQTGYATGEPFCIFEDDIAFDDTYWMLTDAWAQLPVNWDCLYLGGNIIGCDTTNWEMPERYSERLIRLKNAWQSHAIVYSHAGAKFVLDNFDPNTFPVYDEWLRVNMMPKGNTYGVAPFICWQQPNKSDIWQRDVDYTGCHIQSNNWIKQNL